MDCKTVHNVDIPKTESCDSWKHVMYLEEEFLNLVISWKD